jgi:HAE1 family hydrophobic/amphiphilic exporter-1
MFHWSFKTASHYALAAVLALTGTMPAWAQDAAKPQEAAQLPPVSRPLPTRTSGLDPNKSVRWSLRDAILAALENNVDIELERENVRLAQYDITSAQGVYDPLTTSRLLYNAAQRPNTFRFSGSALDTVTSNTLNVDFGAQKQFEKYGTSAEASFNNQRNTSNTANFTPLYTPVLNFSVTQPLKKNFKIDQNRRQIRIAKRQLDVSDATFRTRAIEIISRVQQAYWNLALAIRDEGIQLDAVKLAETQLSQNQRQVEVGTLAPIDVVQSATVLETRRQQVYQAMEQISQAENALKVLVVSGPSDDLWKTRIEPTESFDAKPITFPLDDAVRLAEVNRPELQQFKLQREINKTNVEFFSNQVKPQIDLIGNYSIQGIGGQPAAGIPAGQIFPKFVGAYGTGLKNLLKQSYPTMSVGVQFSFPLRNRTAQANLGRAKEQERQLGLQERRLLQNIQLEVRNAVQAVEMAKLRIEAARAATEYARQQLEGEQKRFAAGLSTTFFVLQRQTDLTQTRGSELRALADYNKAVATLQSVMGTTLSSNSVEVKSEITAQPGDKKWSEIK